MYKLLDKENDEGNCEYKLIINKKKYINLTTQFFFRLNEGNGRCLYIIGIDNNGFLHLTDFKIVFLNTLSFINIIKKYQYIKYKICFFSFNKYIYSIITFYNEPFNNNQSNNFIDFFNY